MREKVRSTKKWVKTFNLPTSLPTCTYLHPYLLYLPPYSTYLPTFLYVPTYWTYLPTYLPTYCTYLPTYLPTVPISLLYLPAYLPTYLSIYLSIHLSIYLSVCLSKSVYGFYLLELSKTWEWSLWIFSSRTKLHRAIEMFRHLRLGCPSHKNLFLFDTRCHIMRLYDMHSERRGTWEHFCTTLSRAWYRSLKVCERFNRRTDFCCGRHFGKRTGPKLPLGRQYGGWRHVLFSNAKKKACSREKRVLRFEGQMQASYWWARVQSCGEYRMQKVFCSKRSLWNSMIMQRIQFYWML